MIAALLVPLAVAAAEPPVLKVTLDEAINAAMSSSERIRAAGHDLDSARARAAGVGGLVWPRISLDASWRYADVVPEMQLDPRRPPVEFGAHRNWSVGPALNWVAWDWGSSYLAWRGARAAAASAEAQLSLARRQVRLSAVTAYAAVQVAAENVHLLGDSVSLAATQYGDLVLRQRAGASSRIDVLQAHQALLARQREFAAARTMLGGAIQDLLDMTGESATRYDTSFPLDSGTAGEPPPDTPAATLVAAPDPLDASIGAFEAFAAKAVMDADHPSVAAPARMADSARSAANGVLASNLPPVTISARLTREFPNGPVMEEINQKTVILAASLPIFEGLRRMRTEKDQREQARAWGARRDSAAADLARDWRKALDALAGLRVQRDLARRAAAEADELARLTYDAYRTGQARLIEVQSANLGALQARAQETRTRVEMLVQLALIRSMSKEEEPR